LVFICDFGRCINLGLTNILLGHGSSRLIQLAEIKQRDVDGRHGPLAGSLDSNFILEADESGIHGGGWYDFDRRGKIVKRLAAQARVSQLVHNRLAV